MTCARHRLSKFLLRHDLWPPAGVKPWTGRHRAWLDQLRLPQASHMMVLCEYMTAIAQAEDRIHRLDGKYCRDARTGPHAAMIAGLQTLRGVGLIHATTLVAELGDLTRFRTPRQLMAYAGVVPRETSTGAHVSRGAITKTGHGHVRYTVIEAAWHYRHTPSVFGKLRRRQFGQPERLKAIAWKAQERLHRRYRRLIGRGKTKQKVIVAVARELLGFLWALAHAVDRPNAA